MNNSDLNRLIQQAQSKTGIDIAKMKQASDEGRLDEFVNKNLSGEASSKIKSVLSDKAACEKLLSSPEAKELMKKLTKGK